MEHLITQVDEMKLEIKTFSLIICLPVKYFFGFLFILLSGNIIHTETQIVFHANSNIKK